MIEIEEFEKHLTSLNLRESDKSVRLLSMLSAVIAVCRPALTARMLEFLNKQKISKNAVYETILQSYLFLGFPRMIEAALVFNRINGDIGSDGNIEKISEEESEAWYKNGVKLCRQVYGSNYEILKDRFTVVSPEIFRWMVLEGYGKVLSRPDMTHIERELAEVAALIVDKRERQLTSHILGSLNVGAEMVLIKRVNQDIKPLAGNEGFALANKIIGNIENIYEAKK
jgi:alkylhydroperoxidase/carboxymuconolactone decarboxylase family protein YurZ